MHISTIGLLTIFLPSIAVGSMTESKSWEDFESMMKSGGSYCLMLVYDYNTSQNLKFMDTPCGGKFPTVKCYYGMEGATNRGQPLTSFNEHFKNKACPAFFFFKNGQQVKVVAHDSSPISMTEIEEAFNAVK